MLMARCGIVLVLVLAATGCSGGNGDETANDEPRYVRADLARFTAVRPRTAGWRWLKNSEVPPPPFTRVALNRFKARYPSQAVLASAQLNAGFVEARERTWRTPVTKGSSFATLFATPEGARDALAAAERFAHEWFTDVEHADISDVEVEGLGDGAWGVGAGRSGSQEFVDLGWRRGNAVLEVYVSCLSCPTSAEDAAREWAGTIDGKT
jgi:hypothetical protein